MAQEFLSTLDSCYKTGYKYAIYNYSIVSEYRSSLHINDEDSIVSTTKSLITNCALNATFARDVVGCIRNNDIRYYYHMMLKANKNDTFYFADFVGRHAFCYFIMDNTYYIYESSDSERLLKVNKIDQDDFWRYVRKFDSYMVEVFEAPIPSKRQMTKNLLDYVVLGKAEIEKDVEKKYLRSFKIIENYIKMQNEQLIYLSSMPHWSCQK